MYVAYEIIIGQGARNLHVVYRQLEAFVAYGDAAFLAYKGLAVSAAARPRDIFGAT